MGASRIASYPAPYVELGIALLLTLPAGSFSDFCIGFHIDFNGSSLPSSGSSSGPVICFGFCFLFHSRIPQVVPALHVSVVPTKIILPNHLLTLAQFYVIFPLLFLAYYHRHWRKHQPLYLPCLQRDSSGHRYLLLKFPSLLNKSPPV